MASMGVRTFTSTCRRRSATLAAPMSSRETCPSSAALAGAAGVGAGAPPSSSSERIFRARFSTGSGTPASWATSMP